MIRTLGCRAYISRASPEPCRWPAQGGAERESTARTECECMQRNRRSEATAGGGRRLDGGGRGGDRVFERCLRRFAAACEPAEAVYRGGWRGGVRLGGERGDSTRSTWTRLVTQQPRARRQAIGRLTSYAELSPATGTASAPFAAETVASLRERLLAAAASRRPSSCSRQPAEQEAVSRFSKPPLARRPPSTRPCLSHDRLPPLPTAPEARPTFRLRPLSARTPP